MKKILFLLSCLAIFLQAQTKIELKSGWNLVGSDGFLDENSVATLLDSVTSIFAYDTKLKRWKISHAKIKNLNFPKVESIGEGEGFWTLSKSEQNVSLNSQISTDIELRYQNGWQMLSPKKDMLTLSDLNKSDIKIVWRYDSGEWFAFSPDKNISKKIEQLDIKPIKKIKKGEGFWLLSKKDNSFEDGYDYIPKDLTTAQIMRFLNKATFGSTPELVKEVKEKGVVKWLDEQLNMQMSDKSPYLRGAVKIAKKLKPDENPYEVWEYMADNNKVFNKHVASFHSTRYVLSSWFKNALTSKDQLRHKVAYALSQIIVESDFEPIFTRRAEALARYFDILYDNAFGSYKQLLTDISFNSGMALFLTFNGSKKAYKNDSGTWVFPDENYARELMQLFSIGLNELNLDGTAKKDAKGRLIPTYTQQDVNELSRVFTGWDLKRSGQDDDNRWDKYGRVGFKRGDFTHPVEFTSNYHDFGEKKLFNQTIPANLSGEEDIKTAIDIIYKNQNIAPYISKNLILRLTKSNPSPSYVKRVATVFQNSGGDLKKVVKAILLDREIWQDIKENRYVKLKEPLVAYTQFLRAFKVKPLPLWVFCGYSAPKDAQASNCTWVKDEYLFNDPRDFLGQGPALAPTVFNFYDNTFAPTISKEFKQRGLVSPEAQIESDSVLIKFSNKIKEDLDKWTKENILLSYNSIESFVKDEIKKAEGPGKNPAVSYAKSDKMLLSLVDEYDAFKKAIGGDFNNTEDCWKDECKEEKTKKALTNLLEELDMKLLGGVLTKDEKELIIKDMMKIEIYNHYADGKEVKDKQMAVYTKAILPLIRLLVTSDKFMVE